MPASDWPDLPILEPIACEACGFAPGLHPADLWREELALKVARALGLDGTLSERAILKALRQVAAENPSPEGEPENFTLFPEDDS